MNLDKLPKQIAMPENPYQILVGDGWESLAPGVRLSHACPLTASGTLDVSCANRGFARLFARLLPLPPAGKGIQVALRVEPQGASIRWARIFGSVPVDTLHTFHQNGFLERSGLFALCMSLQRDGDRLVLRQTGLRFLGVPMPVWFGPRVTGTVSPGPDDQSWNTDILIRHDWFGEVCRYHGIMRAE